MNAPLSGIYIRPSKLTQLSLCAGAGWMEQAVVERFGEPTSAPEAGLGTVMHGIMANIIQGWISGGEWGRQVAQNLAVAKVGGIDSWSIHCLTLACEFFMALVTKFEISPEGVMVEHKLDGQDLGLPNGGTADVVLVVPFEQVILVDWKFGFVEQDDADEHDQLASYAIMAGRTFMTEKVLVYVFQPRAEKHATAGQFDGEALKANEDWVRSVTAAAQDRDSELAAGYEQCRHCKALPFCPEAKEFIMRASEALAKNPIGPTSPDEWGDLASAAKLAEAFGDTGKEQVKGHLTAGGDATGWGLFPSGDIKSIENTKEAFSVASENELETEVLGAMKISVPQLEKAIGPARMEIFAHLVAVKAKAPSLKPSKTKKAIGAA